MFWDLVVAGLGVLLYWETYVAGLEYLAIYLVPMAIIGLIMSKNERAEGTIVIGCISILLIGSSGSSFGRNDTHNCPHNFWVR